MKFGDRYIKFMKDRYGVDELYKFLLLICFVLIVINTFISNNIIRLFEVLLIVIIFYRYMSKNIKLRKKENDKYLEIKDKIIKLFDYNKKKYKDRNTHMYKKCPKCKKKIRLPLKKGKHTVKCPNCGNRFDVACHKDEKIKVEIIK
jgi:DNA-directed RNA polymerase subunit RPC12/RpoP